MKAAQNIDVLIVDDNTSLSDFLKLAIENEGYTAATAANGRLAIAFLKRTRCRLVVTDVYMPEADGIEVLLAMRSHRLPVITMSGAIAIHQELVEKTARQLGAQHIFHKPFRTADLLAAIAQTIGPPAKALIP